MMPGRSCYAVCTPARLFALRLIYASIGIFVGLTVGVIFPLRFNNNHAGGWGLSSAILALLTLLEFVYLYTVKDVRRNVPNPWMLFVFAMAGAIGVGAGVGGFATYLGLGIIDSINHTEPTLPASYYIVCVWCFMNFKWGLTLFLYALKSFKYLDKFVKVKSARKEPFQNDDDDDEFTTDVTDHLANGDDDKTQAP